MERKDFMRKFFFSRSSKLNSSDFDAFVLEDVNKATLKAKQLLGIDDFFINEYNPIIVSTPAEARAKIEPVLVYGKDKVRYDLANFSALFFNKEFLFHYTCLIDHKSGAILNDKVVEIPYAKIKTIETVSKFTLIDRVEHHVFEIIIVLEDLENIVIPLRVLVVDQKTTKEDYIISKDLLNLSANLKGFLRSKIKH